MACRSIHMREMDEATPYTAVMLAELWRMRAGGGPSARCSSLPMIGGGAGLVPATGPYTLRRGPLGRNAG